MYHAWKDEERKVARMFGTERRLLKGTDEKEDIGGPGFPYSVDVKLRRVWSVLRWYNEIAEVAHQRGKTAIITVRQPGKKLRLGIVLQAWLENLLWKHNRAWRQGKLYNILEMKANKWRVDVWFRELEKSKDSRGKIPILYLRTKEPTALGLAAIRLDNLVSLMKGTGYLDTESGTRPDFTAEEIAELRKRIAEEDL